MIGRVEIKYTYDRHEKSNTCIVNVCDSVLVPRHLFKKSRQLVQLVKEI